MQTAQSVAPPLRKILMEGAGMAHSVPSYPLGRTTDTTHVLIGKDGDHLKRWALAHLRIGPSPQ